jgi:hypothetical protein
MRLIQIKHVVRLLSLDQLRKLDEWLHELIRRAEEVAREEKPSSRKQTVRCVKEKCNCARGKLHGPYWYSYSRVKDKVTSQYIGKKLPKDIEKKLKSHIEKQA